MIKYGEWTLCVAIQCRCWNFEAISIVVITHIDNILRNGYVVQVFLIDCLHEILRMADSSSEMEEIFKVSSLFLDRSVFNFKIDSER